MPDQPDVPPAEGSAPAGAPSSPPDAKKKKKKDKVQAAWISFVGRIIAQILGATATVVLGVFVLQKYQDANDRPPSSTDRTAAATPSTSKPALPPREGVVSLAVLPLANFSGDAAQEYFADGMTEALIADLARIEGLRVISRTSSMQYKGHQKSLTEIAQELGVDVIVEGSVAKSGERVRITAQLIDAKRDEHIWAKSYDQTARDVLALQGRVAAEIVREIKGVLPNAQQTRLSERRAVNPAVYDLYLRGRHAWSRRTPEGFQAAIEFFDQAIKQDPDFALAYAGLADTYSLYPGRDPIETGTKAKAAAERALALDDSLAEAHTSLAAILHRRAEIGAATREFDRALDLNPSYATAHQWYSIMLAEEGRADEGIKHAAQAVALDPLTAQMHQVYGLVLYYARQYERSEGESRLALELGPHLPLARTFLARALLMEDKADEAISVIEAAQPPLTADLEATLAIARFAKGQRGRAQELIGKLTTRNPLPVVPLARWYAATGDTARALDMLDRAAAQGANFQPLKNDPRFDILSKDERFRALAARARPRAFPTP
jgi:TolB-like protein/Tfp pilus assembly protein PilF